MPNKIYTNDYDDEGIDAFYIAWNDENGYLQIKDGVLTESPIGDSVGFYDRDNYSWCFEDEGFIKEIVWRKTTQPDDHSMVLTDRLEWTFYQSWEEGQKFTSSEMTQLLCDRKYHKQKY